MHNFLSPLSNTRTDSFGGQSLDNRIRFPLSVIGGVRKAWANKPLFVRISATDWAEGSEQDADGKWKHWGIEQSKTFVGKLAELGVDLVDVSSGGNYVKQKIPVFPGYQVQFADAIKKAYPKLAISTVGLITEPKAAEEYLQEGKADVVTLARALIRDPHWVMRAASELGVVVKPANQYERGWTQMLTPKKEGVKSDDKGKEQGM